jgi:hypothetical protein
MASCASLSSSTLGSSGFNVLNVITFQMLGRRGMAGATTEECVTTGKAADSSIKPDGATRAL